jgi:hypothetical protein
MQKKKLHHNQKQADDAGQAGIQQILPILQKTYTTQRNQIAEISESIKRQLITDLLGERLNRPVALTVERRTPNPSAGGSNPSWPATSLMSRAQRRSVVDTG